jgi:hypothetical protein
VDDVGRRRHVDALGAGISTLQRHRFVAASAASGTQPAARPQRRRVVRQEAVARVGLVDAGFFPCQPSRLRVGWGAIQAQGGAVCAGC